MSVSLTFSLRHLKEKDQAINNIFHFYFFIWQDEETAALVATPQLQQRVLQTTVLNPVCDTHPPALSYRTHFMKQLIQKVGKQRKTSVR